jgi:HEPN domain-containing protein
MSNHHDLLAAWRMKSDHDLKACHQLLQADEPLTDIIIFHAQQAVEKALKGFLLSRHCFSFPKTHDLGRLLDLAESYESDLSTLDAIIELTPYAVEMRYPESAGCDAALDAAEYVQLAELSCMKIWSYVEL